MFNADCAVTVLRQPMQVLAQCHSAGGALLQTKFGVWRDLGCALPLCIVCVSAMLPSLGLLMVPGWEDYIPHTR